MISNLAIIRVTDFIKITPQGNLDFEKTKKVTQEMGSIPGAFTYYDVLIDTRGAEIQLSVFDIWEVARELAKTIQDNTKGARAKISVLCPVKKFDHAKFFELCSQNRGLNMRAFTTFEDVFDWLGTKLEPTI